MVLTFLRFALLIVLAGVAVIVVKSGVYPQDHQWLAWVLVAGIMAIGAITILLDVLIPRKPLEIISSVYFGLIVGLFLSYVAGLALTPVFESLQTDEQVRNVVQLIVSAVLCYTCISFLFQTKDDFRFIIPYVEFTKEVRGRRPYVLDTSVIIDGRIADLVETNLFDSRLVMPRFVLTELQAIADSADRTKRARGRRGLDILNRLRNNPDVDFTIWDRDLPEFSGQSVDLKLITLAKHLEARLVTNDYNLNKVARVHGVRVININDLANALKPRFLPGEQIQVRLVRPGEEEQQGVGYLDDGTMVVVEDGREYVGRTVVLNVTSVLQTSAGRMVFGRYDRTVEHHNQDAREDRFARS